MASNIRFVDSLKVGAYQVQDSSDSNITINNNVNNYLLSATGNPSVINGESNLQFNGQTLTVTGNVNITDTSGGDLILIKNENDQGIKVTNDGVLQLINFSSLPTAVAGGVAYHSNELYVGV